MVPEEKLKTWARYVQLNKNKETLQRVKNIFNEETFNESTDFEIYQQGSVANRTNIWANGDIDIVLQLNDDDDGYSFEKFVGEIKEILDDQGIDYEQKEKCIELYLGDPYQNVDLLPCFLCVDECGNEGIVFEKETSFSSETIVNYPKQHIRNGKSKNQKTGNYKSIVRIFKNINIKLIEDDDDSYRGAKSYFIECLLYNTPNQCFQEHKFQDILNNIFTWFNDMNDSELSNLKCQNEVALIFGDEITQWKLQSCREFMSEAEKYFRSSNNKSFFNSDWMLPLGLAGGAIIVFYLLQKSKFPEHKS